MISGAQELIVTSVVVKTVEVVHGIDTDLVVELIAATFVELKNVFDVVGSEVTEVTDEWF